jgi:hypothetical protein
MTSKSASKELTQALAVYAESAVRHLREQLGSNAVVPFETYKFDGQGARLIKKKGVHVISFFQFYANKLAQLPETDGVRSALPIALRDKAGQYAVSAIQSYLRTQSRLRFDAAAFSKHADAYARMWTSGQFKSMSLSLISGVDVGSKLKLDDEAYLAPLTDRQRENLFSFSASNDLGVGDLIAIKTTLVVSTNHSLKELEGDYGRLLSGLHDRQLQRALTALQLCSAGSPVHQRTYTWFEPQPLWHVSGSGHWSSYRRPAQGNAPTLAASERRQTRVTYSDLADKKARGLDVAFRRLGSSHEKRLPEDALLDLAIGLEVTLTSGFRSDTFTKQMQLRALAIVGDTFPEVDVELADLYEWRGKIVHHGKTLDGVLKAGISVDDALLRARKLVRSILLRYLRLVVGRQTAPAEVNAELDRAIRTAVCRAASEIIRGIGRRPVKSDAVQLGH